MGSKQIIDDLEWDLIAARARIESQSRSIVRAAVCLRGLLMQIEGLMDPKEIQAEINRKTIAGQAIAQARLIVKAAESAAEILGKANGPQGR